MHYQPGEEVLVTNAKTYGEKKDHMILLSCRTVTSHYFTANVHTEEVMAKYDIRCST